MLDINTLKAGMRVSVRLVGEPDLKKRGNPLYGRVTRNHLLGASIANEGTWTRICERNGTEPAGTGSWFVHTPHPGLVVHRNDPSRRYLCVSSVRPIEVAYFVDGRPATAAELEIIALFKRENTGEFATFALENCGNAVD